MGQTWEDLLFAHWRVAAETLRQHVPAELELQTFDGSAWLGITPFRVSALRARGMLPLPGVSFFPELNVRTYVTVGEKPGIWFFSLDAASRVAVGAARRFYRLPYFHARMRVTRRDDGGIDFSSSRRDGRAAAWPFTFEARYRPAGEVFNAAAGTLEHFLTERYCLYAVDGRRMLHRAEIHHPPWPLQEATAEIERNTMPPPGIDLPETEPLLHFARRQDVAIWPLKPVRAAT